MGILKGWWKKPKPESDTFFKFFISEDGTAIDYNFEAHDLDKFLQMMSLLLSGGINEEIMDCIFQEIDDKEIKDAFILDLLSKIDVSLKEQGGRVVVSPSEFTV